MTVGLLLIMTHLIGVSLLTTIAVNSRRRLKIVNTFSTMDVGDATSTTSMDVVKVGLEKQVGLELEGIQG